MRSFFDLAVNSEHRPAARLLVIGDVMLDRTVYGTAERTSPEAPVLVLNANRREVRPGGAAAVAHLLCGLDLNLRIHLAGVVGDDANSQELMADLEGSGIETGGLVVDSTRPTTVKERFVGQASGRHAQQVLRVDYESTAEVCVQVAESLWDHVASLIPQCHVVLISDYAKGVCGTDLLGRIISLCRARQIPVLIDPARGVAFQRYAGCDVIKPNRTWLETTTGCVIDGLASAHRALEQFRNTCGCRTERVLLTLDREGMLLDEPGRELEHFPARIRSVYDVTGAGDMAHAVTGACIANGWSWKQAAESAIAAAGLEVERPGVAQVTWAEIVAEQALGSGSRTKIVSRTEIQEKVEEARRQGRTVVFTNGCFDLLHAGG